MRVLDLPAGKSPREWGRIHGESFRGEIGTLAAIRVYLCTKVGGFKSADEVMAAAKAHLPVLAAYDRALSEELHGIAEGANVSAEAVVVANHYTDLRDLQPDPSSWRPAPTKDAPELAGAPAGQGVAGIGDGCSVIWGESPTGRVLAQTWDMHATAIPYVMTIGIPASGDAPAARLLTVTGCLGMAGMNTARVAVAINNLFSTDATLGVVWPAMVRRALRATTAEAARDVIATSPIGSGHHYFIADLRAAYAIEASGTRRKQVFAGGASYCHTNHCLDADIAAQSKVPPTLTTYDRMHWLERDLARAGIRDLGDAWARLGSEDGYPRSVCTNLSTPETPHAAATCGAIAMNLDTGELWAQQGLVHNVAAESWRL
jgi:isopenicillin-N N-acyltransferase-like protein